jgi:plastocyanin
MKLRSGTSMTLVLVGLVLAVALFGGYYFITKPTTVTAPMVEATTVPTSEPIATMIEITGGNYSFSQTEIKVKVGQPVKIKFTNNEGFHDFIIDELNINSGKLTAGQSKEISFTPTTVGSYEYYCSVGNHRAMGMVGKLIVE